MLQGGNPTRDLFPENTPYTLEETEPHADKSAAELLLDQAGWIKNAAGTREKDGVPLTLDLVAYPQRPGLVTMQPVIKATLTALGIKVNAIVTSGESWDELDQITANKDFDLLLWAQHTLPAGDPQWFLNAFFRSDAGNNFAGLNSSEIDGLIDALGHTETHEARLSATEAAHNAILEEVPVSIVVTPSWHVGFSSLLSSYEPWGSDYYVIRADFGIGSAPTTTVGATSQPTTTTGATAQPSDEEVTKEEEDASGANSLLFGGLSVACVLLSSSLL